MLRLLFPYERAQELFPLVLIALVVPIALLVRRKTRRFALFMCLGMAVTALVVLGVTSLVLWFMVQYDAPVSPFPVRRERGSGGRIGA